MDIENISKIVCLNVGLNIDNLPEPYDEEYINKVVELSIQKAESKLGYSLDEEDPTFERVFSSRYLENNTLRTRIRNIKEIKVYEKTLNDWRELREKYDYEVNYKSGLIYFYYRFLSTGLNLTDLNDLKIEGEYNPRDKSLDADLERLVILYASLFLIGATSQTGDKEMYSIGEFTVRPISMRPEADSNYSIFSKELSVLESSLGIKDTETKTRII